MSSSSSITSGSRGDLAWYNSSVSTVASIRAGAVTDTVGTDLQFYTRPVGSALTEKMRITSAGQVNIYPVNDTSEAFRVFRGTGAYASQSISIDAKGGDANIRMIATDTARSTVFYRSSDGGGNFAESMRITSGGDSLFGTTDDSGSSGVGVKITTATNNEMVSIVSGNFASSAEGFRMYSISSGAYKFYVGWDGVIHATSTSITAISDITLKENIKPLETGLDEVMKLKPRRFDWKNGDGENIAGFIAQEVEEVLPDLVSDGKYTNEETKKSLAMGNMIPTLVKAIQELKAEIETLKTQINN
jgi:hypothetical protein